jgi:hypothetical protein
MLQIKSNFDFLKHDFVDLTDIAKKAELLYSIDTDSCAAKLRLFGELWLYELNRLSDNKVVLKGSFGECILIAKAQGLINLDYFELLEGIRNIGNTASHVRYSQISQKASFQVITKSQLKAHFLAILTLAETIVNKVNDIDRHKNTWVEPPDVLDALKFKGAIFDDKNSVESIIKLRLNELSNMPRTRKRQDLERINLKLIDCEYWLAKAVSLNSEIAAFQSYLYFIGEYHPAAFDLSKSRRFLKHALANDSTGEVNYYVALEACKSQEYDKYQKYIKVSIESSNISALDHYLCFLVTRNDDEYSQYVQMGISINHLPCLLTSVIHDIINYHFCEVTNATTLQKNIKRQLIKLKAIKSQAANFVQAMFNCINEQADINKEDVKRLVNGATQFPKYCQASAFTLFILHKNDLLEDVNTQIVKNALDESEGTEMSGAICFFAAMALYNAWTKRNEVLLPGMAPNKLIKKSVALGYRGAIEFEKDAKVMEYSTRKNKVRKITRKEIKARRKQRHQ